MAKTPHGKVVIIGSGPAGYTAAIYAARAMLEPILIQGIQPGGQLTVTTHVENYPGCVDVIRRPFRISGDSGDAYMADALIIATGPQARWLELPSEQAFRGHGVSAC